MPQPIDDVLNEITKAIQILSEKKNEDGSDIIGINKQIDALQQVQSAIITEKLKTAEGDRSYQAALAKLTAVSNDLNNEAKKIGELKAKLEVAGKVVDVVAKAVVTLAKFI